MNDLLRQMEKARGQLRLDWSSERAERNRRGVLRRFRRQRLRRALGGAALLLVVLSLGAISRRPPSVAHPPVAAGPGSERAPTASPAAAAVPSQATGATGSAVRFRDGSLATLLSSESRILQKEDGVGRTRIQLQNGGARFDVVHNPARVFRVDAGDAAVEVLGTRFTIERIGARARVSVEHGRVRVLWEGGETELTDGQGDIFPRLPQRPPIGAVEAAEALPAPAPHPRREAARRADWKSLLQEGQFERAYRASEPLRHGDSDEPGDLLLLADVARLSRHPAEAVAPLHKVVHGHPDDPRAPLAAFTLGRVLLDDLGRPREAAEAFKRAQDLDPDGPMAQDALAREVEAWSQAGDVPRAKERAETYVRRHPDGRRLRSVRRYGGLE